MIPQYRRAWLIHTMMLLCCFPATAFLIPQTQQRPYRTQLAATSNTPEWLSHNNNKNDPDHMRRRQLLISLLSSASVACTAQPSDAATATETADTTISQQETLFRPVMVPPLDDSQYVTYILPNNGLRVLLCSDPTTNEAAAAMDVHVGACADPVAVPGLAHFNEVRVCVRLCVLTEDSDILYKGTDSLDDDSFSVCLSHTYVSIAHALFGNQTISARRFL